VKKVFSKSNLPMRCRKFEARFEDYLGGALDAELDAHLAECEDCRAAVHDSRFAGNLLRAAWEPAGEPSHAFVAKVMATIQREEARAASPAAFWAPLEFLASRLSLTAAMLLLALSVYMLEFAPRRSAPTPEIRNELSTNDFPQPPRDPVSNEEVLQSLAEINYGHE
jgi:hypothetical protein